MGLLSFGWDTSLSQLMEDVPGSLCLRSFGWQAVFGVLTGAAIVGMLLATTQLTETRPAGHRSDSTWRSAFSAYRLLLVDPMFIGLSFIGAFGISSSFFVYIGSASFVFINHYALSPTLFSLCFALNAASFFAFSQMTARLTARFGLAPVIRVAVSGFAGVTAILAVLMTLGADSLPLMMGFLFVRLRVPWCRDPYGFGWRSNVTAQLPARRPRSWDQFKW